MSKHPSPAEIYNLVQFLHGAHLPAGGVRGAVAVAGDVGSDCAGVAGPAVAGHLLSVAPPNARNANGRFNILLIPSFTNVVLPVPGGPLIAIAVPIESGLLIH